MIRTSLFFSTLEALRSGAKSGARGAGPRISGLLDIDKKKKCDGVKIMKIYRYWAALGATVVNGHLVLMVGVPLDLVAPYHPGTL